MGYEHPEHFHAFFVSGAHGWGRAVLLVLLVVVLVAAVAAVVLVVAQRGAQRPAGAPGAPAAPSGAQQILDERYARGEIDDEEYRRRRGVLAGA